MNSAGKKEEPAKLEGREHRRHRRYQVSLPVEILAPENEEASVRAASRDISAKGVYFTLAPGVRLASEVEFYMTLPPQMCQGRSVQVHCRGRVVRREVLDGEGRIGVAAAIDEYEFVPAD